MKSVKPGGKFIMVQANSKVQRIWKRKSGKLGRKYLAKCPTRWKTIWSKIFDLKKEAFIKKYLAIAAYFLNPIFNKSQFLWRLISYAPTASEFYIHRNFQKLIKVTVLDKF